MKKEIINILKEIEKAEDKDEVVFPLFLKFSKLMKMNIKEFEDLFRFDEDIEKANMKKRKDGVEVKNYIGGKIIDKSKWFAYKEKEVNKWK